MCSFYVLIKIEKKLILIIFSQVYILFNHCTVYSCGSVGMQWHFLSHDSRWDHHLHNRQCGYLHETKIVQV